MITFFMLPRQLTLPPHPPAKLNPSLSYSCSLFALFSALPSFRINHLQPLFGKHPGWGYPNASMGHLEPLSSDKGRRRNCSSITSFRINTCKSVSKQSTLTTFRMNTYAKRGEGGRARFGVRRSCRRFYAVSPGTAPVAQGGVRGVLRLFQGRSSVPASGAAPM